MSQKKNKRLLDRVQAIKSSKRLQQLSDYNYLKRNANTGGFNKAESYCPWCGLKQNIRIDSINSSWHLIDLLNPKGDLVGFENAELEYEIHFADKCRKCSSWIESRVKFGIPMQKTVEGAEEDGADDK